MGRVLGLKNYSQVGVKPWGLDDELAAWWWKTRSSSNGQQSTERIKVLSPRYFTFNIFKKCIYVHFTYVCLFICVYFCICICPSAHMEVKEPIVGICSFLLPCGFCESNPGCQTWWQVPLHGESSYHPLTALLMKKNIDTINWILQFILKLNFYVLTNAKCQLYSNKW